VKGFYVQATQKGYIRTRKAQIGVSERGYTSEQQNKVIYGREKHS